MNNSLNLQKINQEEAITLTKFFISSNKNIFLFGQRGIGKTEIATQAIKDSGYKINYINLSVIERPDLAGYPDIYSSNEVITFKNPAFLPKLTALKSDSVIIFDEIDKASPDVTAPLLEILQFKTVNGIPINAAACILTGNLPEENTYSNLISSALLDRGAKYIIQFNFDKWLDWAKLNNIYELIISFLQYDPKFIYGALKDSTFASPSPRGWALASDALLKAKMSKITDIDTIYHIVSGFVGLEAGLKFRVWYEYYRKFESSIISIIETGHNNINWESLHATEKIAFIASMCHLIKQKIINSKKSKNIFTYLDNLCSFLEKNKVDPEIQIMGFYNSFDITFITKYNLYKCKSFFSHFNKLSTGFIFKK